MIYITGDTHGDFRNVEQFCKKCRPAKDDDVLIILGDAGINYYAPNRTSGRKVSGIAARYDFCGPWQS